ncbi:MAG TPA: TonB-dependent receptor [Cellvibrio sp.]|nr:TonB-dependent receptor [Cellvibrio sp.]
MRLSQTAINSLVLSVFFVVPVAVSANVPTSAPEDFYNLSLAELGQVEVSIATGNSTPIDRAPAAASVITASEIQAMGARNLNEILETVPGLHVGLSSLSRLDSVYSIRGIHTGFNPQVLLMMNGVPVQYNLQGGRPTLFRLPAANIARIEVIRGPGSAIYGADAYAGVINVITKDASTMEGESIGIVGGSFGDRELWAQGATEWKNISVAFGMAYQKNNGDSDRMVDSDLQTTLDGLLGTNASLAPASLSTGYELLDLHLSLTTDATQINLWNWRSNSAGVGAGAAQVLDPLGNDDSKLWLADITHKFMNGSAHWDSNLRFSYLQYDIQTLFRLFPPNTFLPIGSDGNLDFGNPAGWVQFPDGLFGNPGADNDDINLEWVSLYSGFDSHRWRIAIGARRQTLDPRETKNFGPGILDGSETVVDGTFTDVTGTPYIYLPDSERDLQYLSLQDEWRITSTLDLTAGVRYDDYSDFGSTTNPRVALVWATTEKLTSKIMYGSAFRAPAFADLYFKNNPVSLGNSALKPEQIDTVELSLNVLVNPDLQTTITAYTYEATDMIEFVQDAMSTTKTAQNILDQDGKGVEFEITWKPLPQLLIASSYAVQDAENARTGAAVADAPGQQFKANINWEFAHNWFFNSQLNYVADRQRAVGDARPEIDDYQTINITLHRKSLLNNFDFSIAVRNATDEDAREPSSGSISDDYPLESRSFWVGFTYHL